MQMAGVKPLPVPGDSQLGKRWHPALGRVTFLLCPAGRVNTGKWMELGQQQELLGK